MSEAPSQSEVPRSARHGRNYQYVEDACDDSSIHLHRQERPAQLHLIKPVKVADIGAVAAVLLHQSYGVVDSIICVFGCRHQKHEYHESAEKNQKCNKSRLKLGIPFSNRVNKEP